MNTLKNITFLLLLVLLVCTGCQKTETQNQITNSDQRVDELLAGMTLEEKVGQMTQITLDVFMLPGENWERAEPPVLNEQIVDSAFRIYKIGSILNTVNNRARPAAWWRDLIADLQEAAIRETGIPLLYGIDAIHGVNYTSDATLYPQEIGQGASFNPGLVKTLNGITAYEMRASGIPWNFSPVLDMGRDPRDPRIWETYGEDVYLTTVMGVAAVKGMEGDDPDGIDKYHGASCLKHYLAYNSNSGKDRNPLQIHPRELLERHVPAFKAAIDAGARSLMVNSGILNGIPVHMSHDILTQLLRDELGFEGVVVTDWADIENIHNRDKVAKTQKEAVKLAINAGIDMSMVPYNFRFCDYLIELVKEGEVPMSRIDDAVRRILKLKMELGLFDAPTVDPADYPEYGSDDFVKASLQMAIESMTLLKNEGNILPLPERCNVLVVGPNANSMRTMNGGWSYSWQGEKVEEFAGEYNTFLEAIRQRVGPQHVKFVEGVSYKMDGKYYEENEPDFASAVNAARGVDYILLFLGENSYCEKPGDLHDLYISDNQALLALNLVKTGKPVILVLNEGRPRIISRFEHLMAAVIQTYLPSNYGGDALAMTLWGDVNPSGKLPYTYPMFPNSIINYDYKPSEKQEKMEGMYDYESDVALQYEFGHGLSYTSFSYSNFTLSSNELRPGETVTASVKVTNTGGRPGQEVVMLFSSDLYASITPDNRRLRRFEKISLVPGETKTVSFELSPRDLAFYNIDNQQVAEEGMFRLSTAGFYGDLKLTKTVTFGEPSKIKL